jgi:hypothetical protein
MQRIMPVGSPAAYKTYGFAQKRRKATCAEVQCEQYLQGWKTIVPVGSEYEGLVRQSGRRWVSEKVEEGLIEFVFPAGQACFAAAKHTLPWEGHERFIERGGDWRGNPTGSLYVHTRADDWVDSFANHQDKIKTQVERG